MSHGSRRAKGNSLTVIDCAGTVSVHDQQACLRCVFWAAECEVTCGCCNGVACLEVGLVLTVPYCHRSRRTRATCWASTPGSW